MCYETQKTVLPQQDEHARRLIRRLDWRFLLPQPLLRRVAYLGPPQPELTEALQMFSEALVILETGHMPNARDEPFDLVVLTSPRQRDAHHAERLLQSGGFLYWEIKPGLVDRISALRNRLRALEQAGFAGMRLYWHRPDFGHSLEILPLQERAVLQFVFSRRRGDGRGALKFAIGRLLLRTGLLPRLVSSVSIIAQKQGSPHR